MAMKTLRMAFAITGLLAFSGAAYAESSWDRAHDRREEYNEHASRRAEHLREERREAQIRAERQREIHHEHELRLGEHHDYR